MGQVDDVKVSGDIGDLGGSIDQVGHMDALKEKDNSDNSKVEVNSRMKFRWTKRNSRTNGRRFGGFRISAISGETIAATSTPISIVLQIAEAGSTMETDALLPVQRMACCGSGSRQCSGPAAPAEGIAMALLFHFEPWRQNA